MMMPGSFQGTRTSGVTSVLEMPLHHAYSGLIIDNAMLNVDGQRIPARMRHNFRAEGISDGQPAIYDITTFVPDRSQLILSHDHPLNENNEISGEKLSGRKSCSIFPAGTRTRGSIPAYANGSLSSKRVSREKPNGACREAPVVDAFTVRP